MKKHLVIIGGGPAAMTLASKLDPIRYDVTIVEKGKTLGRKFLVAGKGGFNLTHSESIDLMLNRYRISPQIESAIRAFDNNRLREWLRTLNIDTYVGTSRRVFPLQGVKPIEVLEAIKQKLANNGVKILLHHRWSGDLINEGIIRIYNTDDEVHLPCDHLVWALGGASWKITGSDGEWMDTLMNKSITCIPMQPANCALHTMWTDQLKLHIGKPIKNIAVRYQDQLLKGEVLITDQGLEGSPIYAISSAVGHELERSDMVKIFIDLKPSMTVQRILDLVSTSKDSISSVLKNKLHLSRAAIALLKLHSSKDEYKDMNQLSKLIKGVPISIIGIASIDEAISTTGGIDMKELNENFMLIKYPSHYAIGEMLDWDAPTGGYLLQASFSMGAHLADHFNKLDR